MKKSISKIFAILLLSGLLASCAEEEIAPLDHRQTVKNGVGQDDKGF